MPCPPHPPWLDHSNYTTYTPHLITFSHISFDTIENRCRDNGIILHTVICATAINRVRTGLQPVPSHRAHLEHPPWHWDRFRGIRDEEPMLLCYHSFYVSIQLDHHKAIFHEMY
jgi:hypothetical protein